MDAAFQQRLRETFRLEADEILTDIAAGLLDLEQAPAGAADVLEGIYRGAHSLKGAARAVNMEDVQVVCQALEDVFAALKLGLAPGAEGYDLLHEVVKALRMGIFEHDGAVPGAPGLVERLQALLGGGRDVAPASGEATGASNEQVSAPEAESSLSEADRPPAPVGGTGVRPPGDPGSDGASKGVTPDPGPSAPEVLPEDEPASMDAAPTERTPEVAPSTASASPPPASPEASASGGRTPEVPTRDVVRVPVERLEAVRLQVEELIAVRQRFERRVRDLKALAAEVPPEVVRRLRGLIREAEHDQRELEGRIDQLLEAARGMLMMPVGMILEPLRPMVRELARASGKDVRLVLEGADVEVDKRVLEAIRDPLTHLLNNAVDHGLEAPQARAAAGKPPEGTVRVAVASDPGGKVVITVEDDGQGLDVDALRRRAVEKGLLSPAEAEALDEVGAMRLIFASGMSTSPIVTRISGRGLGMAIVESTVEGLGGRIRVDTERGQGTRFVMTLPATLATFRGVIVREGGRGFVIPTVHVARAVRVPREHLRVSEAATTVAIEGEVIAVVRLGRLLELPPDDRDGLWAHLVVVRRGTEQVAFEVEAIIEERELLARDMGPQLTRVRNVAGVTALGSGEMLPILRVEDLLTGARQVRSVGSGDAIPEARIRRVLVVDDSITTRMLMKNIMESAGYVVTTAVDGEDGLAAFEREPFDLVVTDVEMPRRSGIELTRAIRSHPERGQVPVILVTSLASDADRARGIEAGADAYFVKSDFDQAHLLDVVDQLI